MPSTTTPTADPIPRISDSIDRLSLEQALRDVEVANARVIDLTARLTTATTEITELRGRLLVVDAVPAPVGVGRVRAIVAPRIKAAARLVLPAGVRARLRAALR